jgi:hypothetical protein
MNAQGACDECAAEETHPAIVNRIEDKRAAPESGPFFHDTRFRYSCAGNGSMVSGFTGIWTSSRNGDVMSVTRMRGKASMNDR